MYAHGRLPLFDHTKASVPGTLQIVRQEAMEDEPIVQSTIARRCTSGEDKGRGMGNGHATVMNFDGNKGLLFKPQENQPSKNLFQ